MFLEHGRTKLFDLSPADKKNPTKGCLTIVVLGGQNAEFGVKQASEAANENVNQPAPTLPHGHPTVDTGDGEVRSSFGAVSLFRCGTKQLDIEQIVVSMRSQRGAIEVLVARSGSLLGDLREALPERAFGPVAPRGYPGRPLEPGPLAERVVHAEERARAEGAQKITRIPSMATIQGLGELPLRLNEGCHRVEIMSAVPPTFPHRSTDIDAEARDDQGHVLAQDRSESADARLDFCLGQTTQVSIPFAGAAAAVPVMATDAVFAIPAAVPNHWGARTRAGFAFALLRRHAPAPPSPPIVESLGIVGQTSIPIAIEPGRCYLAAIAVARGEPRGLRLSATLGDRYIKDEVLDKPEGTAVAFCSESEESVQMDVEARGTSVWWTFALFALGGNDP